MRALVEMQYRRTTGDIAREMSDFEVRYSMSGCLVEMTGEYDSAGMGRKNHSL